jgi:hypothetical protein
VVSDALYTEAQACPAALNAAKDQGLPSIVLECYSQVLVNVLKLIEYDLAPGGVIFREAKFIMATHFNSVNVLLDI